MLCKFKLYRVTKKNTHKEEEEEDEGRKLNLQSGVYLVRSQLDSNYLMNKKQNLKTLSVVNQILKKKNKSLNKKQPNRPNRTPFNFDF